MKKFKSILLQAGALTAVLASSAFADEIAQPGTAAAGPTPAQATTAQASPPSAAAEPGSADESSAYQLNLLYTGEEWYNATGGIRHNADMYMNNVDVALFVDTEKAFGWAGGNIHIEGFYANQNSLNDQYMGSIDVSSAIDTTGPRMFRLYQAFYDQNFAATGTDVRFGLQDPATEFSTTKPEQLFVNKNFYWNTVLDQAGTMPENGVIGPGDYPYTPLAIRIRQTLNDGWSIQGALADGAADDPNDFAKNAIEFSPKFGVLAIGEVDYEPTKTTKLMAGVWGLTATLPAFNQTDSAGGQKYTAGEEGGYIGGSTRLYTQEGKRGLDAFATLGFSDPVTTNTDQSLNAGLTYTGALDARPHDKVGVAFEENHDPDPYRKSLLGGGSPVHSTEETFEVTYRASVLDDWVTIQPDLQYVVHPGYTLGNDLVFGVHFELGHLFNL